MQTLNLLSIIEFMANITYSNNSFQDLVLLSLLSFSLGMLGDTKVGIYEYSVRYVAKYLYKYLAKYLPEYFNKEHFY